MLCENSLIYSEKRYPGDIFMNLNPALSRFVRNNPPRQETGKRGVEFFHGFEVWVGKDVSRLKPRIRIQKKGLFARMEKHSFHCLSIHVPNRR